MQYFILAIPFILYAYFRIIRPRITQSRNIIPQKTIPELKPYTFEIRVEKDSIEHQIAEETILNLVAEQHGIITYSATIEDKAEYDARIEYNRGCIREQEMKRLGIKKKRK